MLSSNLLSEIDRSMSLMTKFLTKFKDLMDFGNWLNSLMYLYEDTFPGYKWSILREYRFFKMKKVVINVKPEIVGRFNQFILDFNLVNYVIDYTALKNGIQSTDGENIDAYFISFIDNTEQLINSFQSFYKQPIQAIRDELILKIYYYMKSYAHYQSIYENSVKYVRRLQEDIPEEKIFSIILESDFYNIDLIQSVIKSVSSVYNELCQIANIETDSLHIISIETGSLMVKFSGIVKIIKLLSKLYKSVIRYYIRHIQQDGDIIYKEELISLIEKTIGAGNLLKNNGTDVNTLNAKLKNGLETIADDITSMARKSSKKIIVDGEVITNDKKNLPAEGSFIKLNENDENESINTRHVPNVMKKSNDKVKL